MLNIQSSDMVEKNDRFYTQAGCLGRAKFCCSLSGNGKIASAKKRLKMRIMPFLHKWGLRTFTRIRLALQICKERRSCVNKALSR